MTRSSSPAVLLVALVGGGCAEVERGELDIGAAYLDYGDNLRGTVVARERGDEGEQIDVTKGADDVVTLSIRAEDADGKDITPAVDLDLGAFVTVLYRGSYGGFGAGADGIAIFDATGLVLVADSGSAGGAFEDDPDAPMSVDFGEQVSRERSDCEPLEGHALVFHADEDVAVEPVGSATVQVDGQPMQALAIVSWRWAESRFCQSFDQGTDHQSWILSR